VIDGLHSVKKVADSVRNM